MIVVYILVQLDHCIRGKKIEKKIEKEFDSTHISKYAKKK